MAIKLRACCALGRTLFAGGLLCVLATTGAAQTFVSDQTEVFAEEQAQIVDEGVEQASCYAEPSCDLGADCGPSCGAPAYGTCGDCGECCEPWLQQCGGCCNGHVPGFVYGEFLYLRPTGGDIAHAQQQDGNGGAGTVPFGRIGTVDMDHQPGFRVGGGVCLDACSSITVNYTRFEGDGSDSLAQPVIPGGSGAVGSLVQHPGAALTASTGPVTATNDLDYHIGDIMFRDLWKATCNSRLKYLLGGVYASFDQDFQQLGTFSGGQGGAIRTDSTIDFDGAGLKAGIDYERFLGCGLSVYGKASAAAVSGRFQSRYNQVNDSTDVLLANSIWKDNRVISLVEYELGAAYTTCNQRWRVSGGYLFQHWGNMVTNSEFINAVQSNNYVDLGDTLSFDGLTARIEARW